MMDQSQALTLHCPTKLQVEVILGTHAWRFEERRNTIRLSVNIVNKASRHHNEDNQVITSYHKSNIV